MFAAVLIVALTTAAVEKAQPGQGTFRAPDGVLVHFDSFGRGEPVVVLAGGPGLTPSYMRPVCGALAETRECLLLHQRGTGRSRLSPASAIATVTLRASVADLEALRVALGRESITLVGHSWGGMLAMAYAAEHPRRVKALVVLASGGPTLEYMSWYFRNSRARVNDEDRKIAAYWEDQRRQGADPGRVAAGLLASDMSSTFHDRRRVAQLVETLDDNPFSDDVFQQMMRDLGDTGYDLRPQLRTFAAPVLIVQGRQDPIATADTLRATFPSAPVQTQLIDEAGHFLWLEQPDATFQAVRSFLSGVP
jgi:proline iminopeptidase